MEDLCQNQKKVAVIRTRRKEDVTPAPNGKAVGVPQSLITNTVRSVSQMQGVDNKESIVAVAAKITP